MEQARRRLAVILAADVAGYSRLMGADERATVATLNAYRDIFREHVSGHDGRVVDTSGDSVLAVFDSVVEAVSCAATVQAEIAARNADMVESRRMLFRIGVNLGDIIEQDDGTIYGDGVNVAARLEALADPGSICLSESAHMQAEGKIDLAFEDIGEQEVKNIARPVRAYRVVMNGAQEEGRMDSATGKPDKPSIAVLPFDNMSGDPEQEYFSDGITEDILTELSRYSSLFVIARNSTFAYKGRNLNIRDIGRELGAGYVLEGSVRKAGNRVRITAQLIEAATGNHLWAEKYDRDLDDILPRHIESAQLQRAQKKLPCDMAAYDYLLQAKIHHHKLTRNDNQKAIDLFNKAIEIDSNYSEARAWRACTLGQAWVRGYLDEDAFVLDDIADDLDRALAQDEDNSECHRLMAAVCMIKRDFDKAAIHQNRALALNPNDPRIVSQMGELLTAAGKPEEGLKWLELAMRLDPNHGDGRWKNYGHALFVARRYDDAVEAYRHISSPSPSIRATLAACYALAGKENEASAEAARVIAADPEFSIDKLLSMTFYKEQSEVDHHREALLKAGLPG
jgi:adenylate cyclase